MGIGDPTPDNTVGVLFGFILISAALYGAGCLQGWLYFRKYGRGDSWIIKGIVLLVLAADTAQMILLSHTLYTCTISPFDDLSAVSGKMEMGLIIECFFAGIIALLVQHFYCWKIWLLTKSYWIIGFISLFSVSSFVILYVFASTSYRYHAIKDLLQHAYLTMAVNSLSALTDVLISGTIIFTLRGRKTPFKRTSDMINRMIFFAFNSGLPTSISAVLNVITLNAIPQNWAYIGFSIILGRFYTNSLLVTLNSREYIRHGSEVDSIEAISISPPSVNTRDPSASFYPDRTNPTNAISIRIDASTVMHRDGKFEKHI